MIWMLAYTIRPPLRRCHPRFRPPCLLAPSADRVPLSGQAGQLWCPLPVPPPGTTISVGAGTIFPRDRRTIQAISLPQSPHTINAPRQGSKQLGTGLEKEGREMLGSLGLCSALHGCIRIEIKYCVRRPGIGREGMPVTEEGKLLNTLLKGFVAPSHPREPDCAHYAF